MTISKLPWKIYSEEYPALIDADGNEVGTVENQKYIVEVCNVFPEVIEALRMVLHDTMTYDLKDKAEMIMSRAYGIMHRYKIDAPRFCK